MKNAGIKRFVRLLRYALPYKGFVLLQFLFMGLSVGLGVLRPWPLKILVDHVVGDLPLILGDWTVQYGKPTLLLFACLASVVLSGGEALISFGSTTIATFTSSRMIRDLRADLLRSLQRLSLKFHDMHRVGDLVHRVTYNTSAVETAFQSGFMGAIKSTLTLISIFVVMLSMNTPLTLVAIIVVPLLILAIRLYARRIQRVSLQHQDQEGSISSRLQEVLSAIRLVQAFNREPWEEERFDELSKRSVSTRVRMTLVQGLFGFSVAVTLAMGTALLFWVGARQVLAGSLTVGEFLVFNAYLAMLYAPLSVLSYTTSSIQSALGGGSRLFEILEAEDANGNRDAQNNLKNPQGAIEFRHAQFAYEEGHPILRDVDFSIKPGETVALVGETGSGKSTILSLLLGFYRPQQGQILIDGQDIAACSLRSLRDHLSLVPQEALLFSDSVRENIAYGHTSAGDSQIEWAARMAEAHEFIEQLPRGYDTLVGERGIRLSVGQRQRIALARAFLRCASGDATPILLLDEPTSALDANTESRLIENLEQFVQNRTVLLVTHRLSTVRKAHRIIMLDQGRIIEQGSHQDLMSRQGAYYRLWMAQDEEQEIIATS